MVEEEKEKTEEVYGKVVFRRNMRNVGSSLSIYFPKELLEYIDVKEGDEVLVCGDVGKHGHFLGIWNPIQQERMKREREGKEMKSDIEENETPKEHEINE